MRDRLHGAKGEQEGSPGVWQQGDNDVFVVPHRTRGGRYRFEISSGPPA